MISPCQAATYALRRTRPPHVAARGSWPATGDFVIARSNSAKSLAGRNLSCVIGSQSRLDRGFQFRNRKLQQALFRHRMLGSVGQVGSAGDNAAMESFSLLQENVLNRRAWDTREQLRIAIVIWIERTYYRRRRQTALGRLTPVEFEIIMSHTADQAA